MSESGDMAPVVQLRPVRDDEPQPLVHPFEMTDEDIADTIAARIGPVAVSLAHQVVLFTTHPNAVIREEAERWKNIIREAVSKTPH